ncbi:MAG: ABC transporter permease [Dehalococcoidia bacterium]|jgi:peptide/nickel transport system permease protein|nr:ABC transporter permease [Dehalococcoidia bacterium]|tara:strand:+ start:1465 stop:2430 length:966 start_codon:yes stop_codon:yes gene_type:complete
MNYFFHRLITQMLPVAFLASFLVFMVVRLIPGDPAMFAAGGENQTSEEAMQLARERMGLNDPFHIQYFKWLGGAVQGDFGISMNKGVPVTDIVTSAFPATIELALFALTYGFVWGIVLGVLAAVNRGGFWDYLSNIWTGYNIGVPSFIAGLLYLLVFAIGFKIFPASGRVPFTEDPIESLRHLALPTLALGSIVAAQISRYTRQSILDTLTEDYIRTARAKGLRERTVMIRHALKPSLIPVVTIMGLQVGSILAGTLVIEQVFTWPGVGRSLVTAVRERDYTLMQAITLMLVMIFLTVNLLTDLLYVGLDPRIRLGAKSEA